MTRRVEGIRVEPPNPNTAQEVGRSGAVHGKAVERRQLKTLTPPKKNVFGASGANAADPAQTEALLATLHGGRSIDEILTEFVRPRIADSSIVRRASLLLDECVENFVPYMDGGENIRSLATALIGDEIGRHRDFIGRQRKEA